MAQIQESVERRVPLFYGQPDVDASEVNFFMDACKRIEKLYADKPDSLATALEETIFRLRGRAYEIFRDIEVKTFKEFYSTLTRKFLPTYTVEILSNRLSNAKQNKFESCGDFGSRVQSYALDYEAGVQIKYGENNSLPKPLLATLEQEAFVRGLQNVAIKTHLTMLADKPLKELMEMAGRIERQLGYSKVYQTPQVADQEMEQTRCQLCERIGHKARECHSIIRNSTLNEHYQPPSFCRYCKRTGHTLENCNTKRTNDARKREFSTRPNNFITQPAQNIIPGNNRNYNGYQNKYLNQPNNMYLNQRTNVPDTQRFNTYPNKQNYNRPNFQHTNHIQPVRNQQVSPTRRQIETSPPRNHPNYLYKNQQNFQKKLNPNMNELTNDLGKISINYIQEMTDELQYPQGNEQGLVEQQET